MWIAICIFRCSLRIIICRFLCCDSLLGGELRQIVICVLDLISTDDFLKCDQFVICELAILVNYIWRIIIVKDVYTKEDSVFKIKDQPHFLHKHYRRIISFIYLHCALIRSPVCFIKQTSKTASAHNKTVFFFRNRYQIVWSLSFTVHVTAIKSFDLYHTLCTWRDFQLGETGRYCNTEMWNFR